MRGSQRGHPACHVVRRDDPQPFIRVKAGASEIWYGKQCNLIGRLYSWCPLFFNPTNMHKPISFYTAWDMKESHTLEDSGIDIFDSLLTRRHKIPQHEFIIKGTVQIRNFPTLYTAAE